MYEIICMVALPQIRCQLHDHARQYDNDGGCDNKQNGGKFHGNISRNGYGNAIIGRYVLGNVACSFKKYLRSRKIYLGDA